MNRPIVVGIAGGSASGKSTVVREVVRLLGPDRCAILAHDAYYHDLSHLPVAERTDVNVDHPRSLETELLVSHVEQLLEGRSVEVPAYDFVSHTRSERGWVVRPAPVVIVEGLLAFVDESLRALMDIKAYVDASPEDRLLRRIERDVAERGRERAAVVDHHAKRVQPMHDRFVEPTKRHADVVIADGGHNLPAIERLVARIETLLPGP